MGSKVLPAAIIGAGCGLLGAAAMNVVGMIWSKFEEDQQGQGGEQQGGQGSEDATVKVARRVAEPVLGRELTPEEKKSGGPIVHYTFGAVTGALYAGLAEVAPPVTAGAGLAYGTAVWLLGDVVTVPQLKLAPPPSETPASAHFKYWVMHAVYGLTLDGTRRLLKKALL